MKPLSWDMPVLRTSAYELKFEIALLVRGKSPHYSNLLKWLVAERFSK